MFRTAARLVASFAVACTFAACEAPEGSSAALEAGPAPLSVLDCDGRSHTVLRLDAKTVGEARLFDLEIDGESLTLVASQADRVAVYEVALEPERTLALAEVSAEGHARVMAEDGRVFVSESGQGFAEEMREVVDTRALVALDPEVLASLDEATDEGPFGVARQAVMALSNTGNCKGVTCASRNGDQTCCCAHKCVRDESKCHCETADPSFTFSGSYLF